MQTWPARGAGTRACFFEWIRTALAGNRRMWRVTAVVEPSVVFPSPPQPARTIGLASTRHAPTATARTRDTHLFLVAQVAAEWDPLRPRDLAGRLSLQSDEQGHLTFPTQLGLEEPPLISATVPLETRSYSGDDRASRSSKRPRPARNASVSAARPDPPPLSARVSLCSVWGCCYRSGTRMIGSNRARIMSILARFSSNSRERFATYCRETSLGNAVCLSWALRVVSRAWQPGVLAGRARRRGRRSRGDSVLPFGYCRHRKAVP
jgi:hypothetical protein